MHYDYGHLVGYHGMSHIKSNLPKVAIRRSNGFRFRFITIYISKIIGTGHKYDIGTSTYYDYVMME